MSASTELDQRLASITARYENGELTPAGAMIELGRTMADLRIECQELRSQVGVLCLLVQEYTGEDAEVLQERVAHDVKERYEQRAAEGNS